MVKSAVLGYPRVGVGRAMKKVRLDQSTTAKYTDRNPFQVIESYWAGNSTVDQLSQVSKDVRKERWESMKTAGVDIIPRYVR